MAKQDYYETLGIGRSADEKEIKKAYRKLAKKYHPDTNPGDKHAEQKFKEVTEAYDVLGNPEKKKLYDRYGMAAFDGSMGAGDPSGNPFGQGSYSSGFGNNGQYREYHYTSGNMDDINLDNLFSELFGSGFGGNSGNRTYRDRFGHGFGSSAWNYGGQGGGASCGGRGNYGSGAASGAYGSQDLHAEIDLTMEEAALGCDKILHLKGDREERLQVHIPAGINEGQSVRLKGKGEQGWNGSPAGDLIIRVHILRNSVYERKGMDIYTTISIPQDTAVHGGEAYVQTLYGPVKCKIPAGIRQGGKIRLKNKGVVSMKNSDIHGDEYVTIQIQN